MLGGGGVGREEKGEVQWFPSFLFLVIFAVFSHLFLGSSLVFVLYLRSKNISSISFQNKTKEIGKCWQFHSMIK